MSKYIFPENFIFGTAVASYQVEGNIYNNDWTHWENKKNSVCYEPCNEACKHYELLDAVTEEGIRTNIKVGILYIQSWLLGQGAAALFNLMEDAATAEISRSQHGVNSNYKAA